MPDGELQWDGGREPTRSERDHEQLQASLAKLVGVMAGASCPDGDIDGGLSCDAVCKATELEPLTGRFEVGRQR